MIISSRTPEGFPSRCVLCGAAANIEFSEPDGDAPCPSCGYLLWSSAQTLDQLRQLFFEQLSVTEELDVNSLLAADSLDVVELAMESEEDFGVTIPEDDYPQLRTIGDAIRYIERLQREQEPK